MPNALRADGDRWEQHSPDPEDPFGLRGRGQGRAGPERPVGDAGLPQRPDAVRAKSLWHRLRDEKGDDRVGCARYLILDRIVRRWSKVGIYYSVMSTAIVFSTPIP